MNTNLASYIMGMVIDENDHFYFVQKDGQTYALDKAEGPHKVGESVKGLCLYRYEAKAPTHDT